MPSRLFYYAQLRLGITLTFAPYPLHSLLTTSFAACVTNKGMSSSSNPDYCAGAPASLEPFRQSSW